MARAVTEEHEHGQELLGLIGVVVQTLHKEFEASLWTQLTDEGPKFGQKIIQVCQTCRKTETILHRDVSKYCITEKRKKLSVLTSEDLESYLCKCGQSRLVEHTDAAHFLNLG